MKTAEQDFAIRELLLPGTLDGDEGAEFRQVSEALDQMALARWGNLDRASTPRSRLADWRPTPYFEVDAFYARVDRGIAGVGLCRLSLQDNLETAWLRVEVAEAHRGRGIGTALLAKAQESAQRRGRRVLQSTTEHPAGFELPGVELLQPETGAGGVPRSDPGVAFALRNGFSLEQTSRFSVLDLASSEAWDSLEAAAHAKSLPGYRVVTWTDHCPEEYLDQMAVLMGRMSTDSPPGGLDIEAEAWDARRVRETEETAIAEGLTGLVAVAQHRGSGELAAYTVVYVDQGKPWLGDQDDTLVARAHRGHSLGMTVKLANLRRLRAEFPAVERVMTFNAEENQHMLAINEKLGFRIAGYDGEWQKRAK